ncbi:hypothetical protein MAIC_03970 [Mycolicibacterium aichiense]|uniref:Uncharacterized protein n=2 Tax=Mycobacteriaceae TaxID=1762 RepID=A0AAD1HIL6_9MYCO|nr:hypothetical protein MAIC_03970 [Mycolicibacterium aichiense]
MTRRPATTARWKIVGGGPLYKFSSTGGAASAGTASALAVALADEACATASMLGLTTKDVVADGFTVANAGETESWSSRRVAPRTESATATTLGALGVGAVGVSRTGFETTDSAWDFAAERGLCRALDAEVLLVDDAADDDGLSDPDPVSAHATP